MKKIFKYPLDIVEKQTVSMPVGAKILTVDTQYDKPMLWALVNPDAVHDTRTIHCAATGHQLGDEFGGRTYISTVLFAGGSLVFHFFE